jgi:hypothetical protein
VVAWLAPLLVALGAGPAPGREGPPPDSRAPAGFGLYYSGPPCREAGVDRTFSQFQVNLAADPVLVSGRLGAAADGAALLAPGAGPAIRLLSNASRGDWLLSYPRADEGVGVWGRPILGPGCAVAEGVLYVEALFPRALLHGAIEPTHDLMRRDDADALVEAARLYRAALADGREEDGTIDPPPVGRRGVVARLEEALFSPEQAGAGSPWRVRLLGPEAPPEGGRTVEILLSGSDGSTGMFGHIAVGGDGEVYNVYPKGSDRGAPGPVTLWDYLFNTQRGQALRRPTWILRLEGLQDHVAASFHAAMLEQIGDIRDGRAPYHPTANNCTTVSLRALERVGVKVAPGRYFTRRFPRPAFVHALARLPRLIASGALRVERIELAYVPQAPQRLFAGGAPNRPLRDRARVP